MEEGRHSQANPRLHLRASRRSGSCSHHHGEADQRDQGLPAHGPPQGRQERQDQAQQGCGEVQSQVQQVPIHLVRLRHRQGRQVEAISSSRSHRPRLVRSKMALLSFGMKGFEAVRMEVAAAMWLSLWEEI